MDNTGYGDTLRYLYERLPMFSRIGKAALKPDLTNTIKLCAALGDPHHTFKAIHIAGTNGKGSVSHSLAAVLQQAGYKTGLYTSPHLVDFRERIRVNGLPVSKEWVVAFTDRIKDSIEEIQPSFFEITVAMAFAYFAEEKVDIAVIETGLGGRLDSTNVITSILSIITNISYDHKDLLGNTLAEIAAEKAGIIKRGVPTVIGEQHPETERVFFEHSVHRQSVLHHASSLWGMVRVRQDARYQYYKAIHNARREMYDLHTDLLGHYQQHNIKTVLTSVELLSHQGYKVSIPGAIAALANVKRLTGLRGRWDVLQQEPLVVCDVAHNPAGVQETLAQFAQVNAGRKHIVLGFVKDKDVAEALSFFPKNATYYFTNAQIERALPAAELRAAAELAGLTGEAYPDVAAATEAAQATMAEGDALLITGSFFIVGDAIALFDKALA
ncbi:folylpolyglutamate synthase/dihydrofolate synthase family protein [Nemorincola caseinilytica]|uniref:Dihydrofolate synthase/folylpolyglutamate synthase n=1 Tax=Nemorincola caseinilytica TaxID=2054315 RepID=A0ABP8NLG7_9BACT